MGSVKAYTGSAFADVKSVKVWSGSSWINRKLHHWNGSSWVDDSTKVLTFTASMTDSLVPDAYTVSKWRSTNDYPYQGTWDGSANQIGFVWFDPDDLALLAGKAIERVEAYFYRKTGYGNSGDKGLHVWGTSWPASKRSDTTVSLSDGVNSLSLENADALALGLGAGGWGDISTYIGSGLRDGTMYGIALYVAAPGNNDYMACDAYNDSNPPKIRITCY